MGFADDMREHIRKLQERAEDQMQRVVVVSLQGIMSRTPVDTGRCRANWNVQAGKPNLSTSMDTDEGSAASRGNSEARAVSLKDKDVYISNNLPYAMKLEYGWSAQATHGMVRVTAAEVQALINSGRLK